MVRKGANKMNNIDEYKSTFIKLMLGTDRDGVEEFLNWLIYDTDFCKAPASTRFHGNCEGGLLKHSVQVCYNLLSLYKGGEYDSKVIVSLLHDICKADFYTESTRNVKNKETGIWEQVPYYTIDEKFPFGGHGSKSVFLIQKHGIRLKDDEAAAINCHMGGWDFTNYHNPGGAFEKYPLAVYLHMADMIATYIDKT